MKTEPADLDRQAAHLLTAAPGMRVWNSEGGWGRLAEAAWAGAVLAHWTFDSMADHGARIDAIDTDDPATVGCMLAQVEAEAQASVELWHCPDDPPEESGVVFIRARDFASYPGPTRGAALVAAMRAIKGAK